MAFMHRAPVANTPLERPQVLVREALTVHAMQLLDNCRRFQNAVLLLRQPSQIKTPLLADARWPAASHFSSTGL